MTDSSSTPPRHSLPSTDEIAHAEFSDAPDDERPTGASADVADVTHQIDTSDSDVSARSHDPYAALRIRDYRFYAIGSFIAAMTAQMLDVAVAWEISERVGQVRGSRDAALALGYVGLVLALPVIFFALPAGHVADRFDRRRVVLLTLAISAVGSIALAGISYTHAPISWVYACLFALGVANSFRGPALGAMLPQLVPDDLLANAVTWNSSRWQTASMMGPALGGMLIAATHSYVTIYLLQALGTLLFIGFLLPVRPREIVRNEEGLSWESLIAGLRFVRSSNLILATLTLDMFAVLLGGAVMLLPIYARDILHVGAAELGWLRAAPAVGALLMGLTLAHLPPMRRAGRALLWAVAGFGLATIAFGLSRNFWFSLAMLFLTGMFDNISVVVRHTLVQVLTPDNMRGRVAAVNSVFIGSSNELGGFESGVAAKFLGPVMSVVGGGIGTLIVVGATALKWPEVRRLRRLDSARA
ncbi:MAG TPA: MFS transporter [Abditibacteriaceae bacterium]|jgi:MFS family permease